VLRYVGRVGSGLGESELGRLQGLLAPLRMKQDPFAAGSARPRESIFVEPRIVAEVRFTQWTAGGNLRHPTYLGLREDKDPLLVVREDTGTSSQSRPDSKQEPDEPGASGGELVIEQPRGKRARARVAGRELSLSNLDKVLYPDSGFDKRRLIEYYAAIAPTLLPHLRGRALTVTRWPDGVEGKSFFQKQAPSHKPDWVSTVRIEHSEKPIDYVLAEDEPTLVWLANLAAIELHAPLSRAEAIEHPTVLVFDLDPGAPAGIVECCEVGALLEGMFANLGLHCFAKTSGSKGLQVYVPLNEPECTYGRTKPFAKAVAELLEQAEPELVVSRMTKSRRTGKVLIDWSQNDRRKTTIGVYSLRATVRPTASTPVTWEEVRATARGGAKAELAFEADEVLARVRERGDLFAPVVSLVQSLPGL
jgi:bifunctional non-homologous end joining protein LigD